MGTTVLVASILEPAQTFHESLTPSRSSTSSKSKARCPLIVEEGGTCRGRSEGGRRGGRDGRGVAGLDRGYLNALCLSTRQQEESETSGGGQQSASSLSLLPPTLQPLNLARKPSILAVHSARLVHSPSHRPRQRACLVVDFLLASRSLHCCSAPSPSFETWNAVRRVLLSSHAVKRNKNNKHCRTNRKSLYQVAAS